MYSVSRDLAVRIVRLLSCASDACCVAFRRTMIQYMIALVMGSGLSSSYLPR